MSLTLNDDQEKALREWFKYSKRCGSWVGGSEPDVLTNVIAPLMKPWTVKNHFGDIWEIAGSEKAYVSAQTPELAYRIRDLLNESEARK